MAEAAFELTLARVNAGGKRIAFSVYSDLRKSPAMVVKIAEALVVSPATAKTHVSRVMGKLDATMWRMAADAYGDRNPAVAARLDELDDELDELHVSLTAELVSGELTVPVALEMALVARFYERLGDHAVNIGERIRYIAEGM